MNEPAHTLCVPEAAFTTVTVAHPPRVTHRRRDETVGIRHDDICVSAPIVDAVCGLRTPDTDIDERPLPRGPCKVAGPSSVDIFLYCFTDTTDRQTHHAIGQDVPRRFARTVGDHGAEIANPTTTVHLRGGPEFAGLPGAGEAEK